MAWRYNSGQTGSAGPPTAPPRTDDGPAVGFSAPSAGSTPFAVRPAAGGGLFGNSMLMARGTESNSAGAFLRSNAALPVGIQRLPPVVVSKSDAFGVRGRGRPGVAELDDDDDEEEEADETSGEEDEEEEEVEKTSTRPSSYGMSLVRGMRRVILPSKSPSAGNDKSPAGVFKQVNRPLFGQNGAANAEDASNFLRAVAGTGAAQRQQQIDSTFSRLSAKFKFAGAGAATAGANQPPPSSDDDSVEDEELSAFDKQFIRETRVLFRDIDRSYLDEKFVPYEQVTAILTSAGSSSDATSGEIHEKLNVFYELKEELDEYLGNYIEDHYTEFNDSISDFSELILALSGSDETLAQLKVQLARAAGFLESHGEQLSVLRKRAAKALIMREALAKVQACLSCESEVKQLLSQQHYLAAVKLLKEYGALLSTPEIAAIRVTAGLRTFVDTTLRSINTQIIDDLFACVFRQDRLAEAQDRMVDQLMEVSSPNGPWRPPAAFEFERSSSPSAPEPENNSEAAGRRENGHRRGKVTDSAGRRRRGERMDSEGELLTSHLWTTLAADVCDNPNEVGVARNFSRFIPLCVKSLAQLGKLDQCHEAFYAKAAKKVERFIIEFIRVYASWRRRTSSARNVAGGSGDATVRAIRVSAFELMTPVMSVDEAIVAVQRRELRALLHSLFAELEKIIRNVDYLVKTVALQKFPFLLPFLFSLTEFDADKSHCLWDISSAPVPSLERVRGIVARVQETLRTTESNPGKLNVLQRIWAYSDVDHMLETKRQAENRSSNAGSASSSPAMSPNRSGEFSAATPGASLSSRFAASPTYLCLQDFVDVVDNAVAYIRETFPDVDEESLRLGKLDYCARLNAEIRGYFLGEVQDFFLQWDMKVLWSQLHYHVECIFYVLCDAKEIEDEMEDVVTLKPFLRRKNTLMRMQRSMANVKANQSEDFSSLEKLLTSTDSSTGSLRMFEETGYVPFSIIGAVKRTQADYKRANEGLSRQMRVLESSGGSGTASVPAVQLETTALKDWFVFTAMNALTCYECAHDFVKRCLARVPRLSDDSVECGTYGVQGFLVQFIQSTYIPTLHEFHAQQLRRHFMEMGVVGAEAEDESSLETIQSGQGPSQHSPQRPAEPVSEKASKTAATGTSNDAAASEAAMAAAESRRKAMSETSLWPTADEASATYPVLSCVSYVGQTLRKVARVLPQLPVEVCDEFQLAMGENLVTEMLQFLKQKMQFIARGTLPFRLLQTGFLDAFRGIPNARWEALRNEEDMWNSHNFIDADLYLYYRYNSAQRTSGHQYSPNSRETLEALVSLEVNKDELDEQIGLLSPKDLGLRCDSDIVALALMSYSIEWLGGVLLEALWERGDGSVGSRSGSRRGAGTESLQAALDCYVPGYRFSRRRLQLPPVETAASHRLVALYGCLASLSQMGLFMLSVEARFIAFQFLPQLRDESYNLIATAVSADTFVQAYCRRVSNFFSLLRAHMNEKKRKLIAFTLSRPASELVMVELAHLRDKAISSAGLTRLQTNLLVMQTTLQLLLPTDNDVRSAVTKFFARPAIFLRYIPNHDVASDIITSGDYKYFSTAEVDTLIALVFRPESGANDNSLVLKHITLFRARLESLRIVNQESKVSSQQQQESASPVAAKKVVTFDIRRAQPESGDPNRAARTEPPLSPGGKVRRPTHIFVDGVIHVNSDEGSSSASNEASSGSEEVAGGSGDSDDDSDASAKGLWQAMPLHTNKQEVLHSHGSVPTLKLPPSKRQALRPPAESAVAQPPPPPPPPLQRPVGGEQDNKSDDDDDDDEYEYETGSYEEGEEESGSYEEGEESSAEEKP